MELKINIKSLRYRLIPSNAEFPNVSGFVDQWGGKEERGWFWVSSQQCMRKQLHLHERCTCRSHKWSTHARTCPLLDQVRICACAHGLTGLFHGPFAIPSWSTRLGTPDPIYLYSNMRKMMESEILISMYIFLRSSCCLLKVLAFLLFFQHGRIEGYPHRKGVFPVSFVYILPE